MDAPKRAKEVKKKEPDPVPWPFPQWKDGKMVVKKVKLIPVPVPDAPF